MAVTADNLRPAKASWRTPLVIIICGCAIALLSFGPRSSLGFFIQPMSKEFTWGRDVFGLALALQNLLWGLGQPIAGAIADRFGILRVMVIGALLYAGGLLLMRYASTPASLDLGAGVLIGFGLSGCSFNLVLSAFSKLLPPEKRGLALGAGTAAGSFGQFLFAPFGVALIDNFGWQPALTVFALLMLLIVPLSLAIATPPATSSNVPAADQQSFKTALAEAFGHRSYVLLVLGFFTCGFQLAFITVHLPAYLSDRGVSAQTGGWVVAAIGLFNIIGSLSVGWLQNKYPKRYILSMLYFARALTILAFISFPITTFSAIMFGAATGLTWLSTVPPTSALVAIMFGTRWFATLYGFAFVSHQVGGFLGVWLGGIVFEQFGSYTPLWWLSIFFGVLSALINLPIVEQPVARAVAQPA
ncbi:MFS transporter [Bradyrhizobium sp. AUGA SZCCT0240]|uniref:MFS transporter n=1 Tax=unclassified Bradyrhizobium TaxID=2631580 RepID=UPI001BAE0CDA|nr:MULTISPECIES: MFS transporter [unclassified Bradyrhizobium]MBR1190941.1 MFS transporter [Bradyrhizobium sp. AUGA SZCCT0160]MBR1199585.1 MFS transporter [Bradyrhizobium sp. AUGA SZCCT0158]MBR1243616.1 MFS transporter [Bradyrhizobium sp. AUGA SZCCT0274]MBR1248345.1 MFS transporter [Bradyrhizobium sp. AUGA SZCCT0169]MBR1256217.1 MFS transporter [Bradyrhizobium sp. AUGA SZCCT0240]